MKNYYFKTKKLLSLILSLSLMCAATACTTNPNSTLNKNPSELNNATENVSKPYNSNMTIDKNYGIGDKDIVIFSTNDSLSAYDEN